ncbi:hypothetical protein SCALM49S_08432 [Streptomyces californicus]
MVVGSVREGEDVVSGGAPWTLVLLEARLPALAAGVWLYVRVESRATKRHRVPTSGIGYGVAVGLLYGVSSLAIKGTSGRLTTGAGPAEAALSLLGLPVPVPAAVHLGGRSRHVPGGAPALPGLLIVPVCTTVTCVFTAVLGTLAFGESLPDDPLLVALRVGGTALALSVLLAMPRHDPPPPPLLTTAPARTRPTPRPLPPTPRSPR